jgi:hypothetical protein
MSRRLSPSEELPRTPGIRDALANLERQCESSAGAYGRAVTDEDPQLNEDSGAVPATHRLRLYRYCCEGLEDGEFIYAELWDTLENQSNDENLPPGNVIFTVTSSSLEHVEAEANRYCKDHGIQEIADWRDFGSI